MEKKQDSIMTPVEYVQGCLRFNDEQLDKFQSIFPLNPARLKEIKSIFES